MCFMLSLSLVVAYRHRFSVSLTTDQLIYLEDECSSVNHLTFLIVRLKPARNIYLHRKVPHRIIHGCSLQPNALK